MIRALPDRILEHGRKLVDHGSSLMESGTQAVGVSCASMAKKLINGCNQRDRATVSAPLTVPIRLLKFVHGSVRPARLRRVTRPGLLAILTLLGASGVVGVKAETFPFQIYGSAPAGLSRLSGFTDTIPDVVGRIDSHASVVIFSKGTIFRC